MRNLLTVLDLSLGASEDEIHAALDTLPADEVDLEVDLHAVMLTPAWRTHYERVHMQYEAMAATQARLAGGVLLDTHQWEQRVVEFDIEEDDLDNT